MVRKQTRTNVLTCVLTLFPCHGSLYFVSDAFPGCTTAKIIGDTWRGNPQAPGQLREHRRSSGESKNRGPSGEVYPALVLRAGDQIATPGVTRAVQSSSGTKKEGSDVTRLGFVRCR
jgi:hypothetical protein